MHCNFAEYANVPRTIGAVMSHRMATLHELQAIYGLEDVFDMLEILNVDGYNKDLMIKQVENANRN